MSTKGIKTVSAAVIIVAIIVVAAIVGAGVWYLAPPAPTTVVTTVPTTVVTTLPTTVVTTKPTTVLTTLPTTVLTTLPTTVVTTKPPEKLKVALCLVGSITDAGWNGAGYIAAQEVAKKYDLDMSISHGLGRVNVDPTFRSYAERGYKLIFAWSIAFQDEITRVAPDYPNTIFVGGDFWKLGPNVVSVNTGVPQAHGAYLAGMVAADLTKTGVVAFLDGEKYALQIAAGKAYEAGAQRMAEKLGKNVRVLIDFAGVWDDVVAGREKTLALIDAGADVVLLRGDGITLGGHQACSLRGVYSIGDMTDQHSLAPNTIVSSNVVNVTKLLSFVIDLYKSGQLQNKTYEWGLAEDAAYLAPFYQFDEIISQTCKDEIRAVIASVKDGTFKIPMITTLED